MKTPKTCPKCGYVGWTSLYECPRCGIIVEKYLAIQAEKEPQVSETPASGEPLPVLDEIDAEAKKFPLIKDLLFQVQFDMNPVNFWGRTLLYAVLAGIGLTLMVSSIDSISDSAGFRCLHRVNTPFHEAGHIIFRPFGRFITSLGGTLGQLLMPLICMAVLLLRTRDAFGAAVSLWWFGENFLDIAPYINDARAGVLPLLGGNTGESSPYGFHDWEFILGETGLLMYDHALAKTSVAIGMGIMMLSYAWAGYLLLKQRHELEDV